MENAAIAGGFVLLVRPFHVGKEKKMNRREIYILLLILLGAFVIRIMFVPAPGYERDIQLFKIWSQTAVENGVHNLYDKTWCDYPPAYLYILKSVGYAYRVFYPKFNEHTYLFDFLIKFPAILADLLTSFAIFWFLRKKNDYRTSLAAMAAYAFNPVIILNSAYWGQIDSVSVLIALAAIMALVRGKYVWAWGLLTIGILTKTQLVVLLPVLILITWKRGGFRTFLNGMGVAWCTFIFMLSPFLYFHQADRVIDRVFKAVGEYPYLSMNAFNIWWLFSAGNGRWAPDTRSFLGLFSYRTLGTMALGIFFIFMLRYLFYREKDEKAVFFASALASFSFFMLPTEMHERYMIPAFVFMLLAAVNDPKLKKAYWTLSLTAFFNMLIVLFWAYPKNYPMLPSFWQALHADILFSLVNTVLLIYFLYILAKDIKIKYLGYSLAAIIILLTSFYFLKPAHDVYLSDLMPKTHEQQWGQPHMDRSMDGNSLTVNGFIYSKGIGTHAYSTTEYIIDGRYRSLEGMVGLDDEQNRGNKIEAWIYADNKLIYRSGIMVGWVKPHYFHLDISGKKELKLVITDGGDGINCDHGDWLNIKVLP